MIQVDDVIYRLDGSMSIDELFQKIEGSRANYTISMNRDRLVSSEELVVIAVYKDGAQKFSFEAINKIDQILKLEECEMCGFIIDDSCDISNIWYANGICADGSNVDYNNIYEYLAPFPLYDGHEDQWAYAEGAEGDYLEYYLYYEESSDYVFSFDAPLNNTWLNDIPGPWRMHYIFKISKNTGKCEGVEVFNIRGLIEGYDGSGFRTNYYNHNDYVVSGN